MKINASKRLLSTYSKQNFISFVSCLSKVITHKNKKFDAILCGGNSGVAMCAFTQLVYKRLGIPVPPIIPVAVFREGDLLTNKDIKVYTSRPQDIREFLPKKFETGNILVVDDEVGGGRVVTAAMQLLEQVTQKKFAFTLLAEDHNYNPKKKSPGLKISYIPFAHKRSGYYSVIFFIIPAPIYKVFYSLLHDQKDPIKYATCLLLGLPTKELVKGNWVFEHKHDRMIRKMIPNFLELQKDYEKVLDRLITKGLNKKAE